MSMELFQDLQTKLDLLDAYTKDRRRCGLQLAEKERDYKVAKAKKILELRDQKVPVTIIGDLVMGTPEIARLRFERDCAEVLYSSSFDAINSLKLNIRIIENELDREYRG